MTMNEEIKKYPVYVLLSNGLLLLAKAIKSTADYNHNEMHLHHYVKKKDWERNQKWFEDKGINQKLILMPIKVHEQVHYKAIKNMDNNTFYSKYKISRNELLFSRKESQY